MSPNALKTPMTIAKPGKTNAIALPQPNKPKLLNFTAHFKPGKATITHKFSNGGSKEFNFHDPTKATAHVRKAINHEWLHPEKNLATPGNNDINTEPNE
jgi:hypothetical protein